MATRKQKRVVLGDLHVPFQDKRAVELALEFVSRERPNAIDLLGDVVDFYSISRFDKDPDRKLLLQDECDEAAAFLACLRKYAPRAEIIFSEGNHEHRLQKYLWSKAPALSSLRALTVPSLLQLDRWNIRWVDHRHPYRVGHLHFTHGEVVRKHSGYSAKAHLDKAGGNVIHGHTHRLGSHYHCDWSKYAAAWENGCLCDLHPDYVSGPPDWQQGFSVVWFYGPRFHVEQIPVVNYSFVYHGGLYKCAKRGGSGLRKVA